MSQTVSIIGLGTTGARAANSLLAARPDVALTVYDLRPERCETFRGMATLALSAQEALRESAVIVLALPCEREIDRTFERFSDGGIGVRLTGKLVVDLSPAATRDAHALARAIARAGGNYVLVEAATWTLCTPRADKELAGWLISAMRTRAGG